MAQVLDTDVVVRGGQSPMPEAGTVFSGSYGRTLEEAASGVVHRTIRAATAGASRAASGTVDHSPEASYPGGTINERHVHVTEGPGLTAFSDLFPISRPQTGSCRREAQRAMSMKANILYSGFYDFPLAFTARWEGRLYVFVRDFDDDLDEYEDQYRVSLLPPLTDEAIQSSWLRIEDRATHSLGKVAVKDVSFDATHRREIETDMLERLLANTPRELVGTAR